MRTVLRLPAFRRLALAYGLNELAVQIAAVVLVVVVYNRTGSAAGAAVFFLCTQFLPSLISPTLVARLDRLRGRHVLAAAYGTEAILFVALGVAVSAGLPVVPLLVLSFVDAALALTARSLARAASVAATAPEGLLRDGNALTNTIFSVCFIAGPGLGGLLLLLATPASALFLDAGIFLLVAISLVTGPRLPRPEGGDEPRPRRIRDALSYVRSDRLLSRLLGLRAAALAFFTISVPVEVVLARHTLHAGGDGYALLVATWGAGTVVGSAIYAALRSVRQWLLLSLSAGMLAGGFLVMGLAPTLAMAVIGAGIAGAGNGIDAVAGRTAIQESTDNERMTFVIAITESVSQALPGAGILIGGAITVLAGPRVALCAAGGLSLLLVAATWLWLRPLEAGAAPGPHVSTPATSWKASA